jgi:hypothetical protein
MASSVLSIGGAAAATLDCNGGGSLQEAVDAAAPGSFVDFTGTCLENLVFAPDDYLTLRGVGPAVIDGSGALASTVLIPAGALVRIEDVTITGGTGGFGGGIDNSGDLTVVDSFIEFNTATLDGGGIDSVGPLTVLDSTIRYNTASGFGGGVVNRFDGLLDGVDVHDNAATDGGGVANMNGAELFAFDTLVSFNEATFGFGGGFYNDSGASLFVDSSVIFDNQTLGGHGGGIFSGDGAGGGLGEVFVTDSVIASNGAGGGGGIFNEGGSLFVAGTLIEDHVSSAGGAIHNASGGDTIVLGSELVSNTGGTGGGGIFSDSGSVDILDSTLAANTTDGPAVGGAIFSGGSSAFVINNSTLSGNTAESGGAIFNEATASILLSNTTVAANTATGGASGGGVFNDGGSVTLVGTMLAGNTSPTGPDCGGAITSAGYNLVQDSSGCTFTPFGTDLTGVDPLLGPLADNGGPTRTHALLAGSPAIDHLPSGPVCGGGADQRGIVRPRGAGCDIGAFELDTNPDVVVLVEPNGRWHLRQPGLPDRTFWYGTPGDIPLFGDWDGDGIDTPGMWRQSGGGGFAYLTDTLPDDGAVASAEFDFFFGIPGDEVFSGDWDGDGIDTLGINRGGHIFLSNSNGAFGAPVPTDYDFWFGVPGDRAFGGDPDGDGRDTVMLYRGTDGFTYYTNDSPVGPGAIASTADNFFFGIASDSFVSGDWDGNGVDSAAIFRGSNTTVYLSNTNASNGAPAPTDDFYVWGAAGWTPVAGVWE